MYSTCLHCHHALGTNEAIEQFPVGRRLAFDSAKGRLWVVCHRCGRWNLTPIEERWEAVEDCERRFRREKLRTQTPNIGLTRLPEGTELIRVGSPLRPEFAAWRYGAVFRRRLYRRTAIATGMTASIIGSGILAAGSSMAVAVSPFVALGGLLPLMHWIHELRTHRDVLGTRVIGQDGKTVEVTRENLSHTHIIAVDEQTIRLQLRHSYGRVELTGERATRALATLLTRINGAGALAGTTSDAATMIADTGGPAATIAAVAREAARRTGDFEERSAAFNRAPRGKTIREVMALTRERQKQLQGLERWSNLPPTNHGALHRLPRVHRLALEMSLHESYEQIALDAELASLERAWREAEEIAAIADDLLVPVTIQSRLKGQKKP